MKEEIDPNKIIAEFLNLKVNDLTKIGESIIKGTKEKVKITLKTGYEKFLAESFTRYGKSKTFFHRDSNVNLSTFYVPLSLRCNDVLIKSANIKALLDANKNIIISGTGGAGKSIMLKHLFVNSLFAKKQIPVFIELRDLNSKGFDLKEFINYTFDSFGLEIEKSFLQKSLNKGQYIFFLDGLDEVFPEKRESLLKEIDNLTKAYSGCSIVLSTRPDLNVSELTTFSIFNVEPLTLEKSIELINKLPADKTIKAKFISDLQDNLFEKHKSFLSNPLLLSIMLITYGYSADIPNKLSVFYNQAFEALFQRHDALKGAFNRKRETELDIQEFSKILSIFCVLTYEQRKFKFTRIEALEFIDQAKELSCYEFNSSKYLTDLLQSVCLLVEDGLFIYFTHRSFQEYFTAKFIVESQTEIKTTLLKKYQANIREDNVYKLVHELDPDFMEFEIIIPFINDLFNEIKLKKNIGISHYVRFIRIMWEKFEFRNGKLIGTVKNGIINEMVYFIIFNIKNGKKSKSLLAGESEWITDNKDATKEGKERLVFLTENLKTSDIATLEFYKSSRFFSKGMLESLNFAKKSIELRKKNHSSKLFDLLLKEKT
ncbi:NACHT domain-containing protein [Pustulibacterium marinum]|uniref:NACHT domain-containing protein n=1 Tax=Pustulibacterium marinum TaxID=1224947 RepID=A0A1I7FML7_9FLAO|nr:NACHT domain-containing protein [Pustulibacterium marinum]SFU37447.1 NACHT domain-containing protein [Pustulibacterium marinum]